MRPGVGDSVKVSAESVRRAISSFGRTSKGGLDRLHAIFLDVLSNGMNNQVFQLDLLGR